MSHQSIVPCLWFDHQAEEAAALYVGLFPDGRITGVSHYPKSSDNPSGKAKGSILTVEFQLAGQRFTALNGGPHFVIGPSISFFIYMKTAPEADRIFKALAEGGQVLMPIGSYPWSERYGWVADRFGVSWQVITLPNEIDRTTIAPCLMFAGAVHGKAEAAIRTYTRIFENGHIDALERYTPGEGPEGTIKHGRFTLRDHNFVAMDSHIDHGFTFNEGISLQIMCNDQSEVDRYWVALSEGGVEGPCGWLKDRFGVSWQVVPKGFVEWMTSQDEPARDRAFQAMLAMKKFDIAALNAAFGRPIG